ncbi:MAG: hypothetical protein HYX78_01625 [Armatimonadetes bacterium]|nr:hypothetical protein [Armatimonadota bacterium]
MKRTFLTAITALCLTVSGSGCLSAAARIFPKDLPAREWVSFTADGLPTPVTGIVYRNGNMLPGMPLGGLGTGFISLGTDGTLDYVCTIFNNYYERWKVSDKVGKAENIIQNQQLRRHVPTMRLPFLGMSVGGKVTLLSLKAMEGVESAEQIDYWGHYPVADLEYKTKGPVSVGLRAWTPFIAGQAEDSNTPGAVFEIRLRNMSSKMKRGSIAFSFHGPRTEDVGFAADYERRKVEGAFTGQVVSTSGEGRGYAYALGVAGQEKVRFGGAIDLDAKAWNSIEKTLPKPSASDAGCSTAVDFVLRPKENKTLYLILAWYAPNLDPNSKNMYAASFNGALDVAEYLAEHHESLLNRVFAWQQVVYGEKRLPGWLQDSLINVLAILAQESFWKAGEDYFTINESLLYGCGDNLATGQFGDWPVNLLFPETGLKKIAGLRQGQDPNTGKLPVAGMPTVITQVYVQVIDRYRLSTGDDKVLDEWYPSVKAALGWFVSAQDKDGDCLPEVHSSESYLDTWQMEGPACHVSSYWLSTLKIAERMAELQGDSAFADQCRSWFDKASQSVQQRLWNPEVGSYLLYNDTSNGIKSDTVLCDQLIGELWARLHGFSGVLRSENVAKVMATLERLNAAATPFGIRLACRPDGREDTVAIYSARMVPSYSTLAPCSVMAWSGDPHFEKLGLDIVRRTWHNLAIRQNMLYDQPCMVRVDGTHDWGMEYDHDTMLWVFPIAVLKQDICTACSPGGFMHRVRTAGRRAP